MEQQNNAVKDLSGYLYPNKSKATEKQPDLRGKVRIAGKEYLISAWKRSKDGDEMLSISLTDPDTLPAKKTTGSGSYAAGSTGSGIKPAQGNSSGASAGAFGRSAAPAQPAAESKPPEGYNDLDDLGDLFEDFK